MITCTRRLEFDAGHRVFGHESKCKHLHGHRYVAEVTCVYLEPVGTDALGRVVDFGVVKQKVGGWLDANLDHGMILWAHDPMLVGIQTFPVDDHGNKQKVFVMNENPTAENMAAFFLVLFPQLLPSEIQVSKVRVWETPNCYAEATWQA